jgi:hypothetical protein
MRMRPCLLPAGSRSRCHGIKSEAGLIPLPRYTFSCCIVRVRVSSLHPCKVQSDVDAAIVGKSGPVQTQIQKLALLRLLRIPSEHHVLSATEDPANGRVKAEARIRVNSRANQTDLPDANTRACKRNPARMFASCTENIYFFTEARDRGEQTLPVRLSSSSLGHCWPAQPRRTTIASSTEDAGAARCVACFLYRNTIYLSCGASRSVSYCDIFGLRLPVSRCNPSKPHWGHR